MATSYLLRVSTRRVDKLAASLAVVGLSKSQVSAMAAELDELVEGFRSRPPDGGPYTFVSSRQASRRSALRPASDTPCYLEARRAR